MPQEVTSPVVERGERQTFAPEVAGSSPTGTHCERRGEKTLSGLLHSPAILCGVYVWHARGSVLGPTSPKESHYYNCFRKDIR